MQSIDFNFWNRHPTTVAAELIGYTLRMRQFDGSFLNGRIVETEAYHHSEAACHAYSFENRKKSDRVAHFFGPAGVTYVYLNYGIHKLLNVITGPKTDGSAVLIRAIEPTAGIETIRENRGGIGVRDLCNGPGKSTQALGIDLSHNKLSLADEECPISFIRSGAENMPQLVYGPRVGIKKATELNWRFAEKDNPNISQAKENKLLQQMNDQ